MASNMSKSLLDILREKYTKHYYLEETDVKEAVTEWLKQECHPIEGCSRRNDVKALLVLQGQQQMIEKLLAKLKGEN